METKPNPEAQRPETTIPFISTALSIGFMTVSTIFSAIRVRRDPWALAFILSIYILVSLFFICIYIAGRLPLHSPARNRLKVPIWLIFTTLLVLICYRTSDILSPAFAWPVWVLALFGTTLTFWLLFICPEKPQDCSTGCTPSAGDCTKTSPPTVEV